MKKFGDYVCNHKTLILIITTILFALSLIGIKVTKTNYDILVYLPKDIETVKGQDILTEDFNMGSFSIITINNMSSNDILNLEDKIRDVDGVNKVVSLYDAIGTDIPKEYLPSDIVSKISTDNDDVLLVTFSSSTSSDSTIKAVNDIRNITNDKVKMGGMSSMVVDTMNLSDKEITIYVIIAVTLCLIVLELALDSYLIPILLLGNIGISIIFNLGTNVFLGDISYITKALVAVLQLGVTTDFSIFLYHSYEDKRNKGIDMKEAMCESIKETFTSVTASSITTIAGFLVLCSMRLTLGKNLGLVMAKGVFIGLISVITIFPSLLLVFDRQIMKSRHKPVMFDFSKINNFIVKKHALIFIIFVLMIIPAYLCYNKVDVYYKMDESLPKYLESITANQELKDKYNIVSPEIVILDSNIKSDTIDELIQEINEVDGVSLILSSNALNQMGINIDTLPDDIKNIFTSDKYQMFLINSVYDIATDELNTQTDTINKIIKKYDSNAILAGEGPLMKDLISISDTDFINVNSQSIICILIIMIVALKSISLPILLIIAIQTAIFINMGFSYLNGTVLPFIAPIVLGTIQLGATIDYAILMTTNYLTRRKNGMDKEKAILEAANYSDNSILTSGLCFFAATFGVGLYSKIDLVGAICSLIGRGAIISMFVVIIVLPTILLIFDKLIMKTTLNMKEDKNMKKNLKKATACFMLTLSLFTTIPVNALTKNETVYSKINSDGSVIKTTVTEQLINNNKDDELNDLTDLLDIKNISNDSSFVKDEFKVTWSALGKNITYQGTSDKELPIGINITYKLDGKEMTADEMIGKKGHVEIMIKYTNKDKHLVYVNGQNTYLYTPFVVVMGTVIPIQDNYNLTISNGKIMDNGMSNMVVGLATPGLYESMNMSELNDMDKINISFDTDKFELPTMYNIASSKILSQDDFSIFDKVNSISNKGSELDKYMKELMDGANDLLEGTKDLDDGTNLLYEKLVLVNEKMQEIMNGAINLDDGINLMISTLKDISTSLNDPDNEDSITSIKMLIATNNEQVKNISDINNLLATTYNEKELNKYSYQEVISMDPTMTLYNVKYNYENNYANNMKLITLLNTNTGTLEQLLEKLNSVNDSVNGMINLMSSNLEEMEVGAKKLADGTKELAYGLDLITNKTSEMVTGTDNLVIGMETFNNGLGEFDEQGIKVLSNFLNNSLRGNVNKLEKLANMGNDYQTFTMKNSTDDGSTKFVMVLDGKKVTKEEVKTSTKVEKTSFIDRIKNLFK